MLRKVVSVMSSESHEIARHEIALSDLELRIFDVLRGVIRTHSLKTVVRVAGGWVRDKVLGRVNHDMDIAVDDMTGEAFARLVNEHLRATGAETHTVNVIQANPEQSKHLETATVNILGMQIDFVNLRAEEYAQNSRIPRVRFGTAREDALRRDFTVNALFFNVNDETIEDLTGFGFRDLHACILRTPLAPLTTLLDDPLRVMRAVRFASRFGFALATDLAVALPRDDVRDALASKVSRERLGAELDNMLLGRRPVASLRMLAAFGLLPIVFQWPRLLSEEDATTAAALIRSAKMPTPKTAAPASTASTPADTADVRPRARSWAEAQIGMVPWSESEALPAPTATATTIAEASGSRGPTLYDDGMAVVNAVDAVLVAVSGRPGLRGPAPGALGTNASMRDDSAMVAAHAASGLDGAATRDGVRSVKVLRGDALAEADAARAASVSASTSVADVDEDAAAAAASAALRSDEDSSSETELVGEPGWICRVTQAVTDPDHAATCSDVDAEAKRLLLLTALLWPAQDRFCLGQEARERGRPFRVPAFLLRNCLKRRVKDGEEVEGLHDACIALRRALSVAECVRVDDAASASAMTSATADDALATSVASSESAARSAVGYAMRAAGPLWPLAQLFTAAVLAHEAHVHRDDDDASDSTSTGPLALAAGVHLRRVQAVAARAREWGLDGCWLWKPLVNGKDLAALGAPAGAGLRPFLDIQIEWLLQEPGLTVERCTERLGRVIADGRQRATA